MRNYKTRILLSWGVIILFVGFIYYLTAISFWTSDAPFFALKFELDGSDPHEKIDGLKTLLESQYAHYMTWSGRFVCQSTVQFFCGLTVRPAFEICNAIVCLVFLLASFRLGHIRLDEPFRIFMAVSVFFLILATLPFDPPFLINYLWMGTVVILWLNLFSARITPYLLPITFLFSIIAGNSQEAFSVPLSGALCLWILHRRFKLSAQEWVLSAGFFLGALAVIAAPGNYVRLAVCADSESDILHKLWEAAPLICLGAVLLLVFRNSGRRLFHGNTMIESILLASLPFTLLFAAMLKFFCLERMLIPANMFLTIITFGFCSKISHRILLTSAALIACVLTAVKEYGMAISNTEKYSLITRLYHESTDGKIVLPDEMLYRAEGKNFCYDSGWVVAERAINPDKPYLKKYPASLCGLKINQDTTFLKQIGRQAWIIVNSVEHPKKVVVKKRLLPDILNIELPDRTIDFSLYPKLVIDTISGNVVGLYFNNRAYLKSDVIVE